MVDHDDIQRAIGHLQGTVEAMDRKLDDHMSDESTDLKALRKEIRAARDDILVTKTQKRMALLFVGIVSGLASALATIKMTLGKLWS